MATLGTFFIWGHPFEENGFNYIWDIFVSCLGTHQIPKEITFAIFNNERYTLASDCLDKILLG